MTALPQMQLKFDAHQDRGLLRISTKDRREFRFWLTRRYVKALWPHLRKLLESNEHVRTQLRKEDRQAVLEFQHAAAVESSDFATRYEGDAVETPLGEEPVLLAKARIDERPDGPRIICLLPKEGQGLQVALDDRLLHSFVSLLKRTVEIADWDLELSVSEAPPPAAEPRSVN